MCPTKHSKHYPSDCKQIIRSCSPFLPAEPVQGVQLVLPDSLGDMAPSSSDVPSLDIPESWLDA
eukprot:4257627-Alexandrium_andersonii.AAC.1